jgi:hypothetical protein
VCSFDEGMEASNRLRSSWQSLPVLSRVWERVIMTIGKEICDATWLRWEVCSKTMIEELFFWQKEEKKKEKKGNKKKIKILSF